MLAGNEHQKQPVANQENAAFSVGDITTHEPATSTTTTNSPSSSPITRSPSGLPTFNPTIYPTLKPSSFNPTIYPTLKPSSPSHVSCIFAATKNKSLPVALRVARLGPQAFYTLSPPKSAQTRTLHGRA